MLEKLRILLYVDSIINTVDFYVSIGFKVKTYWESQENPSYVSITFDNYKIMLVKHENAPSYISNIIYSKNSFQILIRVKNITQYHDFIQNLDIPIIQELTYNDWKDYQFSIKDPNGYVLTFYNLEI